MSHSIDAYDQKDLIILARNAKKAFIEAQKTKRPLDSFLDFFPPPVCEHADERISNVLHIGRKKGTSRMYKGHEIASTERRSVRGLHRWDSQAPLTFETEIIVKNPKRNVPKEIFKSVGAHNFVVIYPQSGPNPKAYLGALTEKGAYIMRPVIPELLNDIVKSVRKLLK